jgi:hypothetical protein
LLRQCVVLQKEKQQASCEWRECESDVTAVCRRTSKTLHLRISKQMYKNFITTCSLACGLVEVCSYRYGKEYRCGAASQLPVTLKCCYHKNCLH